MSFSACLERAAKTKPPESAPTPRVPTITGPNHGAEADGCTPFATPTMAGVLDTSAGAGFMTGGGGGVTGGGAAGAGTAAAFPFSRSACMYSMAF